jgi:hypothetical protein
VRCGGQSDNHLGFSATNTAPSSSRRASIRESGRAIAQGGDQLVADIQRVLCSGCARKRQVTHQQQCAPHRIIREAKCHLHKSHIYASWTGGNTALRAPGHEYCLVSQVCCISHQIRGPATGISKAGKRSAASSTQQHNSTTARTGSFIDLFLFPESATIHTCDFAPVFLAPSACCVVA